MGTVTFGELNHYTLNDNSDFFTSTTSALTMVDGYWTIVNTPEDNQAYTIYGNKYK